MDDISSQRKILKRNIQGVDNIMSRTTSRKEAVFSFGQAQQVIRTYGSSSRQSTLLSRGKRTRSFYTNDSHRYLTNYERTMLQRGVARHNGWRRFESAQMRFVRPDASIGEKLQLALQRKYSGIWDAVMNFREMTALNISPVKLWNASIVGAIFFGMFSMTLIYKYLGQRVSAEDVALVSGSAPTVSESSYNDPRPTVLGESTESVPPELPIVSTKDQDEFNRNAKDMVKGYPIEVMLPYILKQDRQTASFLIAIAKKESNWGKRVPVLNGEDCFNYWGYRGIRDKMGTGGHTCFDSPQDAVETVAKRLNTLIHENGLNSADKLIIWKCGSSCAGHSKQSVKKWIQDVDTYFKALNPSK